MAKYRECHTDGLSTTLQPSCCDIVLWLFTSTISRAIRKDMSRGDCFRGMVIDGHAWTVPTVTGQSGDLFALPFLDVCLTVGEDGVEVLHGPVNEGIDLRHKRLGALGDAILNPGGHLGKDLA